MNRPVPSAKQLESTAFICAVLLAVFLAGCTLDGFDGVTSKRSHTYLLLEEPRRFWGTLMIRWGFPAILFAILAVAFGLGALAAKGAEKASTDQ